MIFMQKLCCLVTLLLPATSLDARPAEIILLRHAEKTADDHNPKLSPRGLERAQALPSLLTNSPAFSGPDRPVAVFAPRPTTHGHGRRAEDTITPLAAKLRLRVRTLYAAGAHASLAREVLSNPAYDGKTVVICWEHDDLPHLAHELGVHKPPNWNGGTFDRLWVVTWDGDRARLRDLPQHLLPGDSLN